MRAPIDRHEFVADQSVSISRGIPLSDEPALGALTLSGFIREVTERFAGNEALVHQRPDGTAERWSYADLWNRSVDVAKSLVAVGLGKGERVGILMTNRPEFLSSVFGTALAGGIATPLSTFSTPVELEYLIAQSACSVLLVEKTVLKKDFAKILLDLEPAIGTSKLGALASEIFPFLRTLAVVDDSVSIGALESWDDFIGRGTSVATALIEGRAVTVAPADPGVLFFSSGSTNKPKGILSAHRGVTIQLWRMRGQQGLAEGVRTWTANGFFWSGNFAMAVGATLAAGGSLILQKTFQPDEALYLMTVEKVAHLFAWPHQWGQLCASPAFENTDLSSLIYVDMDSPITRNRTVKTSWIEPRHAYGNTETFTLSTAYPADTTREAAGDSHGLPLPGNALKIVDPLTGIVTPVGIRGEIAIKGPTLMLGYLGTPLDESLDDDGYFRTGDGGYIDAAGRLFWEGRLNDIIKTGGANVSPLEIDEVITQCPGVKVAQTIGIPDDLLGELVVTCIVPNGTTAIDEDMVRAFAREKLASYKVPRRVLFLAEGDVEMTGSAKVKTVELRRIATRALELEQGNRP